MDLPNRKHPRLKDYDYSSIGAYFITVCARNKECIFSRITVSSVIGALRRFTNQETGEKLWQTGFYDHIVRDKDDFLTRWQYIDNNPAKWYYELR